MSEDEAGRQDRDRRLFDAVSEKWCRKDLLPASSGARRHRLDRTLARVPLESYGDVLEIGCGAGFAARYLEGRFRSFTGIDPSEKLIELAGMHNRSTGVQFEAVDIASFDARRRFDVVFMVGVLHHIPLVEGMMPRIGALLRPGGWLAVNEPQPANPIIRAARAVRSRLERAYSAEQEQISETRLRELVGLAGLIDVQIMPQGFLSTPFAEVILRPLVVARLLSSIACPLDSLIEDRARSVMRWAAWNLIATGRRPQRADDVVEN